MKKVLLFALLPFLAACNKDDDKDPSIVHKDVNEAFSYNTRLELNIDNNGKNDIQFKNVLMADSEGGHNFYYINTLDEHEAVLSFTEELFTGKWLVPFNEKEGISDTTAQLAYWAKLNGVMLEVVEKGEGVRVYNGPLAQKQDFYVGIRLRSGDGINYGWIRLRYAIGGDQVHVLEYAYNPVPGKEIRAGQK